jgi:hypothetical protein
LIKTILAWFAAQIQLHIGSATLNPFPRLAADDVSVGPIVLTCQLTGCWHGMPTMHADAMLMSWWYHPPSRLATWVGSSSIRVRSAHPGEGDAWHASVRVSSHLAGAWRPCSKSNFCAVFTSVLVSSSSKQWYGQNIILTTFIFEQKSNTALN